MTSNTRPGIRILGELRSANGTGVVRIHDRYDTDVEDLWTALTEPERFARWYGRVEGDLRPGGQFRTYIEASDIASTGRVDECEPPPRLQLTTRETDESYQRGHGVEPHDASIEVTLTAVGDQTDLTIEVHGMPLDNVAAYGAGWQIHAENLADHLAVRERSDTEARWSELLTPYQNLAAQIQDRA